MNKNIFGFCIHKGEGGNSPRQGFSQYQISTHPNLPSKGKERSAFTLAEVLITLGIIGVVASMTIPTLIADYQTKSYNTAATVFERKLGEALKVMNSQSTLAGFSSTEDFVKELSKHFKINKVCQNNELLDCFEEEVFWGSGTATPEAVDMSVVKTSKNFGQKDWQQTNVVGVQFASGVTALVAYNKDAIQDPYSNQIVSLSGSSNGKSGSVSLGTDALAILYDTNGAKSPNQSAKDLRSINVSKLGSACFAEINGLCITMDPQVPTPHVWNACQSDGTSTDPEDQKFMSDYGISKCMSSSLGSDDYWAGAVKTCGGISKMPTVAQLSEIANFVYNTNGLSGNYTQNLNLDTEKVNSLGFTINSYNQFVVWTGEEYNSTNSDILFFGPTYTGSYSYRNGSDSSKGASWIQMICIE